MRILIVTETMHAGGAETFTLRLCRGLRSEGIQAEILNLNPDIENKELLAQYCDIKIHRVRFPLFRWIKKLDRILLKLKIDFSLQHVFSKLWLERSLLHHYDIFHSNLIKADYWCSSIKRKHPGLKLVSTVHGDYSDFYYRVLKGSNIQWLNLDRKLELVKRQVNKWVVITGEQEHFFKETLQIPASRMEKFYNGFSAELPLNKTNKGKAFIVGMVARGVKLKGWDVLIEAFRKMPENCELRLVGTGEYLDELRSKYKEDKRIVFTGFHPEPIKEIANFDVFVLPSLFPYESLPTVIIEALFCKKPVIATNVGEIEKMITDSESGNKAGYLLDFDGEKVSVQQLYKYLMEYYKNRILIECHGKVAAAAFEKFNMKTCMANYMSIYKELSQ